MLAPLLCLLFLPIVVLRYQLSYVFTRLALTAE